MTDRVLRIRLNTGAVVERPYREAVRLLSRRLADPVPDDEHVPLATVPLEADTAASADEPTPEDAGVDAPEDDGVRTLADLTKAELVAFAEDQGLATSGTKQDLIDRLSTAPVAGATPENVPGESGSSPDGRD